MNLNVISIMFAVIGFILAAYNQGIAKIAFLITDACLIIGSALHLAYPESFGLIKFICMLGAPVGITIASIDLFTRRRM